MKKLFYLISFILTATLHGYETDYFGKALTQAEENRVIGIAKSLGLQDVQKIKIYNVHPGSDFLILIMGDEKRVDRTISGKRITMWKPEWARHRKGKKIDGFYTYGISPYTKYIIKADEKEYAVSEIGENAQPSQYDKSLSAFLSGKAHYNDSIAMDKNENIDFTRPMWFSNRLKDDIYTCGFHHKTKRLISFVLDFRIEGGEIRVFRLYELAD